jgi:hypothetical protein
MLGSQEGPGGQLVHERALPDGGEHAQEREFGRGREVRGRARHRPQTEPLAPREQLLFLPRGPVRTHHLQPQAIAQRVAQPPGQGQVIDEDVEPVGIFRKQRGQLLACGTQVQAAEDAAQAPVACRFRDQCHAARPLVLQAGAQERPDALLPRQLGERHGAVQVVGVGQRQGRVPARRGAGQERLGTGHGFQQGVPAVSVQRDRHGVRSMTGWDNEQIYTYPWRQATEQCRFTTSNDRRMTGGGYDPS